MKRQMKTNKKRHRRKKKPQRKSSLTLRRKKSNNDKLNEPETVSVSDPKDWAKPCMD